MIQKIDINGKAHTIPNWVKNVDAYRNYVLTQENLESNKEREVLCPNGNTIFLDNLQFRKSALKNGFTKNDLGQFEEKRKFFQGIRGKIGLLKNQAKLDPGKFYDGRRESVGSKLIAQNETLLLELFGRWFTPAQVHKELIEKGIETKFKDVELFYRQNIEKIRESRNTLSENYDDLPIGIKRSRLEKLNHLLDYWYNEFDNCKHNKKLQLDISKEIGRILEQARKEVEGEELKLTINGRIDIEATINVAMKNSVIMQDLTVIQMVVSRVCQRTGIPYNKMVHRLANSYYSRYAGLRKSDSLNEKPVYPSTINYDIIDMRPKYDEWMRQQQAEDAIYVELEPSRQEKEKSNEFRNQLLNRLNVSRDRVERIENELKNV